MADDAKTYQHLQQIKREYGELLSWLIPFTRKRGGNTQHNMHHIKLIIQKFVISAYYQIPKDLVLRLSLKFVAEEAVCLSDSLSWF